MPRKKKSDVAQVTNYDEPAPDGPAPATMAAISDVQAENERLTKRLNAAEELIQAQSDLLDAWALRKNRNPAMQAVFNARNEWVKLIK